MAALCVENDMKTSDIICKILSEVTGKPESDVRAILDMIPMNDKELTDKEARELLTNLRKEKAGILAWLVRGRMQAEKRGYIEIPESVRKHIRRN
jgi:hypothetical protein